MAANSDRAHSATSPPRRSVLVIDDDPGARKLIGAILRSDGLRVIEARQWLDGLAQARARRPEAIVLDPHAGGASAEPIAQIRAQCDAPVLIVSDSGREDDKVRALEAGAEDYVTKPFGSAELLARVRVALRRSVQSSGATSESVIRVGDLRIDLADRLVFVGGAEVHLTPLEYRLFRILMKKAGRVVTHGELLHEAWGPDHEDQADQLRVYVSQLRHKLEKNPRRPRYLITQPAVGYRIRAER